MEDSKKSMANNSIDRKSVNIEKLTSSLMTVLKEAAYLSDSLIPNELKTSDADNHQASNEGDLPEIKPKMQDNRGANKELMKEMFNNVLHRAANLQNGIDMKVQSYGELEVPLESCDADNAFLVYEPSALTLEELQQVMDIRDNFDEYEQVLEKYFQKGSLLWLYAVADGSTNNRLTPQAKEAYEIAKFYLVKNQVEARAKVEQQLMIIDMELNADIYMDALRRHNKELLAIWMQNFLVIRNKSNIPDRAGEAYHLAKYYISVDGPMSKAIDELAPRDSEPYCEGFDRLVDNDIAWMSCYDDDDSWDEYTEFPRDEEHYLGEDLSYSFDFSFDWDHFNYYYPEIDPEQSEADSSYSWIQ